MRWARWLRRALIAGVVLFLVVQLVPYGRDHTNPPVTAAVEWPSAEAERLARAACYDCHSNETTWPWYSNVAPVSWLVQRDVVNGRNKVNFSEWNREQEEIDELHESVEEGSMPPWQYFPTHPESRLSASEKAELIEALEAVEETAVGESSGRGRGRGRGGDDD